MAEAIARCALFRGYSLRLQREVANQQRLLPWDLTPYLEIGGDYREVVPGVFLAELPLPFSMGLINVWFVRLRQGWMLVDTGMNTPACMAALDRAREGLGLDWLDLRVVLLTHFHPDHVGLAPDVAARSGAQVWMHRSDEEVLRWVSSDTSGYPEWQRETLTAAGVRPTLVDAIIEAMAQVDPSFRPISPDVRLEGGETLDGAHGPIEVLWTPGHSPGHVCLRLPAQRALISGDHVLEHISPNISWLPGRDPLGDYLASVETVASLDIDLVLPSHGTPFRGHTEWAGRARAHHRERCEQIRAARDRGARTAAELVAALWETKLSPFHYRFAVFEVISHLEYLKRRA